MNGNKYLSDTNILLYLLAGNKGVLDYLNDEFYISEITEIELLGNKDITALQHSSRTKIINNCTIITLSENIKKLTIKTALHFKNTRCHYSCYFYLFKPTVINCRQRL